MGSERSGWQAERRRLQAIGDLRNRLSASDRFLTIRLQMSVASVTYAASSVSPSSRCPARLLDASGAVCYQVGRFVRLCLDAWKTNDVPHYCGHRVAMALVCWGVAGRLRSDAEDRWRENGADDGDSRRRLRHDGQRRPGLGRAVPSRNIPTSASRCSAAARAWASPA